jgi:hypothetical protein
MITKRGFLTGAASAAAVAAARARSAGRNAFGPAPTPPRRQTSARRPVFDLVVFNDRYSDARVFADVLGRQGTPGLPIAGDAGTLWYGALAKHIAGGRRRFAGIGTPTDLLILESLAREVGLRVQLRTQHDCRGRRTLTHSISGASPASRTALAAGLEGSDWAERLAPALVLAADADGIPQGSDAVVVTNVERSHDHPGMLISWVLAERKSNK